MDKLESFVCLLPEPRCARNGNHQECSQSRKAAPPSSCLKVGQVGMLRHRCAGTSCDGCLTAGLRTIDESTGQMTKGVKAL